MTPIKEVHKVFKPGTMEFQKPLIEGVILKRISRFSCQAIIEGRKVKCHVPTTGSIGGWDLSGLTGLFSGPRVGGATEYTLEALSAPRTDGEHEYVGVNQSASNRYVEAAILLGRLERIYGNELELWREVKLGDRSRIDFKVKTPTVTNFLEVKTPLRHISIDTTLENSYKNSGGAGSRMVRHVGELDKVLEEGSRAQLALVHLYNAPRFNPPRSSQHSEISQAIDSANRHGLERWQINFAVTPEKVEPLEYIRL